jgi:TRAP-type C4-dicarboxylate transport system substrate-binding protein
MTRPALTSTLALLSTIALLAGCTGSTGADKSGGSGSTTVMVLASNDGTLDGVPALARFVDEVKQLSGGRVTIRVESAWQGGDDEPRVIRDVAAGKADLGWSGTRAFDQVGVDAFRPVQAPFLVSSLAAQAAIIKDPLAGQLLGSLTPKHLVGLALVADEIRHPVGIAKPLLQPSDFTGLTFQTFASGAQSDALTALGAAPTSAPVRLAANGGHLGGFESMWWTYQVQSYADFAPYVSANVDLWPRSYVIFASSAALDRLDAQARTWVRTAATDAATWSTVHALDAQDTQVANACRAGARVATATPEQLASLRKAAEPVYAALRADPALGSTLTRIETLVSGAAPDAPITVPAGCTYAAGEESRRPAPARLLTAAGSSGQLPQGVYRYSNTVADLTAHGVDDHDALINAGVFTWTLSGGRWHLQQVPVDSSVTMTTCDGYYDVHGSTVAFTTTTVYSGGDCSPRTWTARWQSTGGGLAWSAISVEDPFTAIWAPRAWRKIG